MKTFNTCLAALNAFVAQRSGICFIDYGNRDSFMGDYRPMLQQGKDFRKMAAYVSTIDILDNAVGSDLVKASDQVFSGRLQFEYNKSGVSVNYCTGQYFPTEYRLASCWLISRVIRNYWSECGYSYPEIKAKAKQVFGRGIASRYFN